MADQEQSTPSVTDAVEYLSNPDRDRTSDHRYQVVLNRFLFDRVARRVQWRVSGTAPFDGEDAANSAIREVLRTACLQRINGAREQTQSAAAGESGRGPGWEDESPSERLLKLAVRVAQCRVSRAKRDEAADKRPPYVRESEIAGAGDGAFQFPEDMSDEERWALVLESFEEVMVRVDRLPSFEREIVRLRYIEGLSFREISKTLDRPEATVRSRLSAAIEDIRRELGHETR